MRRSLGCGVQVICRQSIVSQSASVVRHISNNYNTWYLNDLYHLKTPPLNQSTWYVSNHHSRRHECMTHWESPAEAAWLVSDSTRPSACLRLPPYHPPLLYPALVTGSLHYQLSIKRGGGEQHKRNSSRVPLLTARTRWWGVECRKKATSKHNRQADEFVKSTKWTRETTSLLTSAQNWKQGVRIKWTCV